jgi:two-component system, NtrC family, sensor histidine kinase AtoS
MIPAPVCVLYTQDPDLSRRVKAFLRAMAQVRLVSEADRLDAVLQQTGPCLLITDLRARECRDLIEQIQQEFPDMLIVALGVARSEPLREAEQFGIYATEDLEFDRRHFQGLVGRALDYLKALQENWDLRKASAIMPSAQPAQRLEVAAQHSSTSSGSIMRLPSNFRRFENIDGLLGSIVESVADTTGVARVGIFSRTRQGERYRLRAGLRCLPETGEIEFGERDALVRWFESHAYLISRTNLGQTTDHREHLVMRRALDAFGAEVIVPLYARGRIIGWLFFGHHVTGRPFATQELERLMALAEQVSTVLENAVLYQEVTLQKTLAETLLQSIPPGIVAVDEEGFVRWFNSTAEQILGVPGSDVLHRPVEVVGSRLAGFLRDTLDSKTNLPSRQWIDTNTHRSLSVETRRLADHRTPLGAVAVLHDLTAELVTREKQALLDRATFWSDLAASMSHEIRNPLVAIKTFAQLLPERFDDADFRKEFNEIVVREIDRLDRIITQINNFAHPPEIVLKPIDVRALVKKGLEIARSRFGVNGDIEVEASLPNDLPQVMGDEEALAEAFAHLVANAAEAVSHEKKRRIALSAKPVRENDQPSGVVVTVRDNGKGIAPELKDKVFSPFCTTKPRGMGLGLPIVKRTIFDHNGRVDIDSGPQGTSVSVLLPVSDRREFQG